MNGSKLLPLSRPAGQRPRVLIAGGGVAALETLLALRAYAGDRIEVRMLSASPWFVYRPLAVAEAFGAPPAPRLDLRQICAEQSAHFQTGTLKRVDCPGKHALTETGGVLTYDALVLALGARRHSWMHEAATLFGPGSGERIARYVREAEEGRITSIAFVVPPTETWPLPVYELALMAARRTAKRKGTVAIKIVTPESEPLGVFGPAAAEAVQKLLTEVGVEIHTGRSVVARDGNGALSVVPHDAGPIVAERIVTLPRLTGPGIEGVGADPDGFVRVNSSGQVTGHPDTYAAGDTTTVPMKQVGVAAQQGNTVAEHIAARAGAEVVPSPFRPTLSAMLLTGGDPLYLRAEITGGRGQTSQAARDLGATLPAGVATSHVSDYLLEHGADKSAAFAHDVLAVGKP